MPDPIPISRPLTLAETVSLFEIYKDGIGIEPYLALSKTLVTLPEFSTHETLYNVFAKSEGLQPYKDKLPEADTVQARVDLSIAYLWPQNSTTKGNALMQLIDILSSTHADNPDAEEFKKSADLFNQWLKSKI